MKISIEFDASRTEEEIIIRCNRLTEEILRLQAAISDLAPGVRKFVCYQDDKEYYIPLDEILFSKRNPAISAPTPDIRCIRPDFGFMSWKSCFPALLCGFPNPRF